MAETRDMKKAALRGEPSYVWREGQKRRLAMIVEAAGERLRGKVLVNGCGVGMYMHHLADTSERENITGLDVEFERLIEAKERQNKLVNAVGESLPFQANQFDLVLSHEVLEHVRDDRAVITEIIRVLRPGGRLILFCPNRGYPFETHGFYWRGRYHFGNIPLINYLPHCMRDRLAPHVKVYTRRDLSALFTGLSVKFTQRLTIFGAYDNLIARNARLGRLIRTALQWLEKTPLQRLGLSHFWVVEKS